MDTSTWLIIFIVDILIAYLIANYQKANGYTFVKSFFGALIGVLGLTLLAVKGILSL
tara:strand:- start:24085 stop:24255 length:171 start_codon:yes stop_codon:yes gene_type:complete